MPGLMQPACGRIVIVANVLVRLLGDRPCCSSSVVSARIYYESLDWQAEYSPTGNKYDQRKV